jgi:NAD/NADP transhydrogenase alpha subunit
MLRGIRIVSIIALAIMMGYAAGELRGASSIEQKAGLTALLLVSIAVLVMLGFLEAKKLNHPKKKKHRFHPTQQTNRSAKKAGEAGYSDYYSARPNEEAWRVRKQQRGSKRHK